MTFLKVAVVLWVTLAAAGAEIFDWKGEPLREVKLNTVAFRGWVPEGTTPLRGVLVLIPGRHGDGRGMAEQKPWQDLATQTGFALIGCQFSDGDPFLYQQDEAGEVAKAIDTAVSQLALLSKHPELENAPLAFWGTSAGSNVSARYCALNPKRVVAFASSKGTSGPRETSQEAYEIPMFFALGAKDKPEWLAESKTNLEKGTQKGAPWTVALSQSEGHEVGESLQPIYPFFKAAIEMRLAVSGGQKASRPLGNKKAAWVKLQKIDPKQGWLGNPDTYEVARFKDFKGAKSSAVWFCNEEVANAWKSYVQPK
jgi:hypothetical protein